MRSGTRLVGEPGFEAWAVRCVDDHRRWSGPEPGAGNEIVLVRSGRFRVRSDGRAVLAEPSMGYLQARADELAFAHPAGGDACTSIRLSPTMWAAAVGSESLQPEVPVDGRTELAHRLLLRAAANGDSAWAAAERLLDLVGMALRHQPATLPVHRAPRGGDVADRVKDAILAGEPATRSLVSLSELLRVSPFHLSRVFRHATGSTITAYRNRIRVSRALARLEGGQLNLAELAGELGFADQAHLTRTVKAAVGHTPQQLRRLLAGPNPRAVPQDAQGHLPL